MSQNYKFLSDQFTETDHENENQQVSPNEIEVFKTGNTKTIDFVLKDGTRQNFPYSHYLTAWLTKEEENRVIKVFFATHLVTIHGYCLDEIYNQLIQFKIALIKPNDLRYLDDVEEGKPFVSNITIEWKNTESKDN